jgi:hypothetical protein
VVVADMNSGGAAVVTSGGMGTGVMTMRSPFTVSQWQELEHQALIYKYMVAGLPVPPDLVLPIQRSFESISHRFFHHPASKPALYIPSHIYIYVYTVASISCLLI